MEVTNYQTAKMPTGVDVPEYIADRFGAFYDALFDRQVERHDGRAVFLEYAWPVAANIGLCDPCSAPPLSSAVLAELGANWTDGRPGFITRLHVRYDRAHFPEDLQFQETPDQEQYQARYVINHPADRRRHRDLPADGGLCPCPACQVRGGAGQRGAADRLGRQDRRESDGRRADAGHKPLGACRRPGSIATQLAAPQRCGR